MRFRDWFLREMALSPAALARAQAMQAKLSPLRQPAQKQVQLTPPQPEQPKPAPKPQPQTPEPDFSHEDHQMEDMLAEYFYKIIEDAVRDHFASNKQQKMSELLKPKGGVLTNGGSIAQPEWEIHFDMPKVVNGVQIPQKFLKRKFKLGVSNRVRGASISDWTIRIWLYFVPIMQATSFQDEGVQRTLARLQYQLHHEMSHMSSATTKANSSNNTYISMDRAPTNPSERNAYVHDKVNYFTDPGEMKANAKQYAVLYNRYYPGQPFNFEQMMKLMDHQQHKIELLFKGFVFQNDQSHPSWGYDVTAYRQQISESGATFLKMVNFFVNKLLEWRQRR